MSGNVAYNNKPLIDDKQDWKLIASRQNSTHTALKFTRKFKTCDEQDRDIEVRISYQMRMYMR